MEKKEGFLPLLPDISNLNCEVLHRRGPSLFKGDSFAAKKKMVALKKEIEEMFLVFDQEHNTAITDLF